MLRSSYFWRLYLGFLALLALALAGAWVLGSRELIDASLSRSKAQLAQRAQALRGTALEILRRGEVRGEAGLLPALVEPELRASVLRRDGLVLADSRESPRALPSGAGSAT